MRLEDLGRPGKSSDVASVSAKTADTNRPTLLPPGTDQVELSRLSQAMASPQAGSARLEGLRQAHASGTYQVDALQVAKSIIRFYLSSPSPVPGVR